MRHARLFTLFVAATACFLFCGCFGPDDEVTLQGAGATFPAPLYKRWFLEYYRSHPEVRVNYQPIGSGAGIRQFSEELTHFGASDAAMSDEEIGKAKEMARARQGVILLPMTAGTIALSYNLPGGPKELKLSRKALAGIVTGSITQWNDPAITAVNPGVQLPEVPIVFVRRSDGSGTTYAFTNHLCSMSPEWKAVHKKASKSLPSDFGIGNKGNAGVAALIQQTPGAIGYLETGYAELSHLPMAFYENKAGAFLQPSIRGGQAALLGAKLPENLRLFIPDPPQADAYPIVTYTWMLCARRYEDAAVAATLKQVLKYCLTEGQNFSAELGYVPLPEAVRAQVLQAVDLIQP